jgi:hypothetical protein
MAVPLYMDVHVSAAVTEQLPRRGADVLTAVENGARRWSDGQLLERARVLNRVVFTQDAGFKALAELWQAEARPFAGLAFAHQLHATIGQLVRDRELIAHGTDPHEWVSQIVYLPL